MPVSDLIVIGHLGGVTVRVYGRKPRQPKRIAMQGDASRMSDCTIAEVLTLFDAKTYNKTAVDRRDEFRANLPFPHIVIDDFFPINIAQALADQYPKSTDAAVTWKRHANANVSRNFVEDTQSMSPLLRAFSSALNSRQFLLFLETISGIESLICDPYFIGGGAMMSGTGEFLKIHADFNWHHKLQAHRRLNALFYLTPDWNPHWGGELELWDTDMTRVVRSVQPLFNRVVIFEVNEDSNHGQPQPLATPRDIARRVFSAFYYTTRKDEHEWAQPHFTLYKPVNSPYSTQLLADYIESGKSGSQHTEVKGLTGD